MLGHIRQECDRLGLVAYHTVNSQGSDPGFPDLLIAGKSIIFRELKPQQGDLRWHQRRWFHALRTAGYSCEVWRPGDWCSGRIRRELEVLVPPVPFTQLSLFEEVA